MTINYPEKVDLANTPTPLYRLNNLSRELGVGIYVKRDDYTGIELSGNKVRKLEFLMAEALECGADTVVTCGGIQSNHCRATAAAAVRLGLKCHLILRCEKPTPPYDGNLLLNHLFGASFSFLPMPEYKKNEDSNFEDVLEELRSKDAKPFYFGVGGSVPTGCWGYILAFEEMVGQLERMDIREARIYHAIGSGGTMTGLVLGQMLMNKPGYKIVAYNVCDDPDYFRKKNSALLNATASKYGLELSAREDNFNVRGGYVGPGYAEPYPELLETIHRIARTEALPLDPVYTGKGFHGLITDIEKGNVPKDLPIVFINTGGVFGLFPQKEQFRFD